MGKGGGNSGFPLFSPNAGIIFPGGLLQGKSLNRATPDPIGVKRAPGTISTDILDGNRYASITVPEVNKSSVTQAVNDIIRNSTGVVPANFSFSYKSIQSREEFAMELGVDVKTKFTEVESKLNLDFSKQVNRYYVKLDQSFYTMSFDMPRSYDDVFHPDVTVDELAKYVGPGNPACYISDVTYGRIFYMIIESSSSKSEMELAVSGSFNGVATKVDGDLAIDKMKKLKNLNISVFAFGGKSEETFDAIGLTNINDLKRVLGAAADIRSGKALSYVVKSVYDNRIVSTQLAIKYDVTNCIPAVDDAAPVISKHWPGLSATFGIIGAAFNTAGNETILINAEGDQYMISNTGSLEGPFQIENLGGEGEMPFDRIGAACNLNGNGVKEQTIMIFDETGTKYSYLIGGIGSRWRNSEELYNMGGGICPFNSVGVGAMTFLTKSTQGPSTRYFYNTQGNKYTKYNNNPQSFTPVKSVSSSYPFRYIGASIGMFVGNEHIRFYFDKESAQYTVSGNLDGTGSKVHGPFQY
jgi:thiol-activated cytolysin